MVIIDPIHGPKRSEVIAAEILRDILGRSLPTGERLPAEAVLASEYGTGRVSVREALRLLEVHGVLTVRRGSRGGPLVSAANPADFARMARPHLQAAGATIGDVARARCLLEPMLAALAARRAGPDGIAHTPQKITHTGPEDLEGAAPDDADRRFTSEAVDFHAAIGRISGNRVLAVLAQALREILVAHIGHAVFPRADRARVQADHVELAAAIAGHRSDDASLMMRRHLERYVAFVGTAHPGLLERRITLRP